MINFKREYIGLEQDRLLYPVSFKDKAKCNVYGRKKFITEAGEVQLSAHVFLISKDFWTFNAGQLDFTNYPNGIWNDYISIDIIEKDEYTAPSINFGSMGDITPENLQGLSDYISKHLSDLEKRIVEDYLFIDEGVSENIELPNLPENHFWARRNGVIVGVNLDYLKADYEHFKNELWKNYESFNEKLQAALKKYYDDLELQMNNFFKDLIEKIREEAEKQLGLIAGAGGGLLHKIDQANHGFIFDPIVYENGVWKKATTTSGVDGIGVVISANTFFFLEAGEIEIPQGATDKDGQPLLDDEYYYMNEDGGTGFQKEEPVWFYQPLFHTRTYKGKLLANVHIDTMEDLRGQVVDTESGRTHGIALWGDIVPKFDTIEKLQKAFWLKEGEVVEVLGYYSAGDGAGHKRIIKAEDDGSGVRLSNNLWACIVHNGEVNVSWFGAKGDKVTDDTEAIQKTIDYAFQKCKKIIACGDFLITNLSFTQTNLKIDYSFCIDFGNANFIVSGTGIALNFVRLENSRVLLGTISYETYPPNFTNNTIGIRLQYVAESEFNFNGMIIGFKNNILVEPIGSEFVAYNTFNNLVSINSYIHLLYHTQSTGNDWFNENTFYAPRFTNFSDCPNGKVYIESLATYSCNKNAFVDGCMEGDNIDVLNLKDSYFSMIRCRFEANKSGSHKINFSANNHYSKFLYRDCFEFREDKIETNKPNNIDIINFDLDKNANKKIVNINGVSGNFPFIELYDSTRGDKVRKGLEINSTGIKFYDYYNTEQEQIYISGNIGGAPIIRISKAEIEGYGEYARLSNKFLLHESLIRIKSFPSVEEANGSFYINNNDNTLNIKFSSGWKKVAFVESNTVAQLNTLYHMEKMKQEGVYNDYISYMDEKTTYDKQQRKLEQDRQLAYEEALKENPKLTYEEFMSVQPMLLNIVEEPQPSQALKDFMEKYL